MFESPLCCVIPNCIDHKMLLIQLSRENNNLCTHKVLKLFTSSLFFFFFSKLATFSVQILITWKVWIHRQVALWHLHCALCSLKVTHSLTQQICIEHLIHLFTEYLLNCLPCRVLLVEHDRHKLCPHGAYFLSYLFILVKVWPYSTSD